MQYTGDVSNVIEPTQPQERSDAEVLLRYLVSEQDIRDTMRVHCSLDCLPEDLYWKPAMDELFPPTNAQAALIAAFEAKTGLGVEYQRRRDGIMFCSVGEVDNETGRDSCKRGRSLDELLLPVLATHLRTEDAADG